MQNLYSSKQLPRTYDSSYEDMKQCLPFTFCNHLVIFLPLPIQVRLHFKITGKQDILDIFHIKFVNILPITLSYKLVSGRNGRGKSLARLPRDARRTGDGWNFPSVITHVPATFARLSSCLRTTTISLAHHHTVPHQVSLFILLASK